MWSIASETATGPRSTLRGTPGIYRNQPLSLALPRSERSTVRRLLLLLTTHVVVLLHLPVLSVFAFENLIVVYGTLLVRGVIAHVAHRFETLVLGVVEVGTGT